MTPELKIEQGSPEWHAHRAGRLTASHMGDIMAKRTTKRSNSYINQVARFLAFGIMPDESVKTWHLHGMAYEEQARAALQWEIMEEIRPCGMFIHPEDEFLSASPDGVNDAGNWGVEIKCRSARGQHDETIRKGKCPSEYYGQVQAQRLCAGLDYVVYCDYYVNPNDPSDNDIWHVRVEPDSKYQVKMISKYYEFWERVLEQVDEFKKERYYG